jgi:hypothetical protein
MTYSLKEQNRMDYVVGPGNGSQLLGIPNLLNDVPGELITLTTTDYAELVLAKSTIQETLPHWRARGNVGDMANVKRFDAVTVIRRALARCPDEFPPSATTELLFISDPVRCGRISVAIWARLRGPSTMQNGKPQPCWPEPFEALLHWRLQEPSPGATAVQAAVPHLVSNGKINRPHSSIDRWELHQFIGVAEHFNLLKPDTCSAVRLAQNFRNLIHPGRAARLAQTCDRGTAYSAVGALDHVIRDLT